MTSTAQDIELVLEFLPHLRTYKEDKLPAIAEQLRSNLIDSISHSGGHFASSLGVTELTLVLHYLFDTPNDLLIWDTGHQGYIHKMLTGRLNALKTIRQKDGISGFLKRSESVYDTFGAGHAGTSISAATGMAAARNHMAECQGEQPLKYVLPIIGDGSLTSGMAFEALNHSGDLNLKRFIVVLNDNEWSISKNVGALSWFFSRFVTSEFTNLAREKFKGIFDKESLIYRAFDRVEDATQAFLASPAFLFEAFGYRYIGPVDGHDIPSLLTAFKNAKNQNAPIVVHVKTVKGKGYGQAEEDPIKWHAVKPGQVHQPHSEVSIGAAETSKIKNTKLADRENTSLYSDSYSLIFAKELIKIAKSDSQVVAITAAMAEGTGLDQFRDELPAQFYDVGICEQHAVTFAAGLATEVGIKPVCAIYSTFMQRAFDQIIHDVAIQKLGVLFILDRAGVVGNDGETHQGVFDIAYLKIIPHLVIFAPKDACELKLILNLALTHSDYIDDNKNLRFPMAIRFPRGTTLVNDHPIDIPFGKIETIKDSHDAEVLILAVGTMVDYALKAADEIAEIVYSTIVNVRFIKPLDEKGILELIKAKPYKLIATLEDGTVNGLGSDIATLLLENGYRGKFHRFGVPDEFIPHATQEEQHEMCGYSVPMITKRILSMLADK